jgi:hypothetical protein
MCVCTVYTFRHLIGDRLQKDSKDRAPKQQEEALQVRYQVGISCTYMQTGLWSRLTAASQSTCLGKQVLEQSLHTITGMTQPTTHARTLAR